MDKPIKYFLTISFIFLALRFFIIDNKPTKLIDTKYNCQNNSYTYSFLLVNKSNVAQKGSIRIQAYKAGGIKSKTKAGHNIYNYALQANDETSHEANIVDKSKIEYLSFIHSLE